MISQEQSSSINSSEYPDLASPSEETFQPEQEGTGSEVQETLDNLNIETLIEKIQEGIDSGEQVEEVVTQGKEQLKTLRQMMRQLDKAQELGSQAAEQAYQDVETQYREVLGKTAEAQSAQDLRDALSDTEGDLFEKIVTYHARQGDVEETKQDYADKLTDTTQEEIPQENQEQQQEKGWFGKMTERVKEKGGKLWNKAREFWNKDTDDKGNKLTWYQKAGRKMAIGGGIGVAAGLLGATGIAGAGSVAAGLTGGLKLGVTAIAAQTGYEKALNKIRQGDEQKLVSQVHEASKNPETYQDLGKTQEMLHNLQVLAGLTGEEKYMDQMNEVREKISHVWGENTVAQEQQKNEISEDQEEQEDQDESEFQSLSVKDIHKALDRREYQQSLNQDKKQKERQQKTKAFATGATVGAGTHFLAGQIGGAAIEAVGDGANAVSEVATDQTVTENLADTGESVKEFAFGSEVHAAEIGKPGEFVRVDVNGDGEYQVLSNAGDFELVKEDKLDPGEELGPNQTAVYSPETGEVEIGTLHPENPYPGYEMVDGRLVPENEVGNDTQGVEETQQDLDTQQGVTEEISQEPEPETNEESISESSNPQPEQTPDPEPTSESEPEPKSEPEPEPTSEPESDTQEKVEVNEDVEEDSNPESHEEIPDVSADEETQYWIEESSRTGKSFDEMSEWEIIKAGGIQTLGEDGEIQWSLRQPEVKLDIENQDLYSLPEGHVAVWDPEMQEVDSLPVAKTHSDLLETPLDPDTVPWGEPETGETDQIPEGSQQTPEADVDGEAHPESNSETESDTQEEAEVEEQADVEEDSTPESHEELSDVSANEETKHWIERSSLTEKPFDEMSEREIIEAGGIKTVGEEGEIQWRFMQSDSSWESQEHTPDRVPDGEVVIWNPETGELEVEPVAESHRYLLEPDQIPEGSQQIPEQTPEPESKPESTHETETQEKDGVQEKQESSEQNTESVEPEPPQELEDNIAGETYQLDSGDSLWSVMDQSLENLDIEGLSDGEKFVLLQEFMMDASEGGGKEQIYQLLQNSQAGEQFLERIDVDSLDEWMKQDDPAMIVESSRYLGTGELHGVDDFIVNHIQE